MALHNNLICLPYSNPESNHFWFGDNGATTNDMWTFKGEEYLRQKLMFQSNSRQLQPGSPDYSGTGIETWGPETEELKKNSLYMYALLEILFSLNNKSQNKIEKLTR
jgi:hypothetical protein